jgi:hypothetical protein
MSVYVASEKAIIIYDIQAVKKSVPFKTQLTATVFVSFRAVGAVVLFRISLSEYALLNASRTAANDSDAK